MCSISGLFNKKLDAGAIYEIVKKMNKILHHRGPDKSTIYLDKNSTMGMGMNRLSIMDIYSGDQPFISDDKRYVLIFNGEIINAEEIKKELLQKKILFKSKTSDTEVLLNFLIHMDGLNKLEKLNGMFAFVFYDTYKKNLYLVRDRFGIKPLFYCTEENSLYFASELKAIKGVLNRNLELNNKAISEHLSLMYNTSNKTIYRSINKIPSGCFLKFNLIDCSKSITKWFDFSFNQKTIKANNDEIKEELDWRIQNAIKKWTISDVPISCSLSGGLDSSIITKIISDEKKNLSTFSLGFEDKLITDELNEALKISKICKTNHNEIQINEKDLASNLSMMIDSLDEPYGGGLPSWFVYKCASKNFKVILTGTGSDELFGNYGKWDKIEKFKYFNLDQNYLIFNKLYFEKNYYFNQNEKKKILNPEIYKENYVEKDFYNLYKFNNATDPRNKTCYIDLKTQLQDEFLQMTDRFSMAHSLEARPCFLENDLVSFALSIPSDIRMKNTNLKYLIKDLSKKHFPENISKLKKKGFVLPLSKWINDFFYKEFEFYFDKSKIKKQEIFNDNILKDYINPMLNKIQKNQHDFKVTNKLWSLLMFQKWYEKNCY